MENDLFPPTGNRTHNPIEAQRVTVFGHAKKPKRLDMVRRCRGGCGTILSVYNTTDHCSVCRTQAVLGRENEPEILMAM
jgi:hypothetical protein